MSELEVRLAQPSDGLVDVEQAAKLLAMTPRVLRAAARRRSLPVVRLGDGCGSGSRSYRPARRSAATSVPSQARQTASSSPPEWVCRRDKTPRGTRRAFVIRNARRPLRRLRCRRLSQRSSGLHASPSELEVLVLDIEARIAQDDAHPERSERCLTVHGPRPNGAHPEFNRHSVRLRARRAGSTAHPIGGLPHLLKASLERFVALRRITGPIDGSPSEMIA